MGKIKNHILKHPWLFLCEFLSMVLLFVMISPVYIVIVNSFKSREQIFNNPLSFEVDTTNALFTYYIEAMKKMNFLPALLNSLIITICSVILIGLISSLTAWVLVRTKKKSSKVIFGVLVLSMLIPFQTVMIPLKKWMDKLHFEFGVIDFHMLDSRYGLIIMYVGFGLPLATILFHSFIKNIPKEIEEAAIIDGCTPSQVFVLVVMPLLKPIYFTVAILNTLWIWNDYLLPSIVISSSSKRTIPLSTFYFFGEFTIQWNLALGGLVLAIIPVIIFYAFAQKYIIKGVVSGAVK